MSGSPFLSLPGAVVATGADAGVAAHYGDPFGEQRALDRSAPRSTGVDDGTPTIVDLSNRGVLAVTGEDRLTWIDSLTSQSVSALQPGQSAETLLLDPTGRIEHAARLVDDGVTLFLLVERDETDALRTWLDRMRFMLRVEVSDASDELATIGTTADPERLGSLVGESPIWRDPWQSVAAGGHQYARGEHPGAAWSWSEMLVPRSRLDDLIAHVAAGQVRVAGTLASEALRIAAWRPRFATEVDERSIPHELDWLRTAVHLAKGCYRGQETVAKVHNLGHPPRRLVMLHLDGSDGSLPAAGTPLARLDDGSRAHVGTITSSARHWELGPIALAVVKRGTDDTATLVALSDDGEVTAAQQVIVPTDAGAAAEVPRIPRLGAVRR